MSIPQIVNLLKERSLSVGDFTLSSGLKSKYYFDIKKVIFNPQFIDFIAEEIWTKTKNLNLHAIGGLEMGAIPISTASILKYYVKGENIEGFFVRKNPKSHGAQNLIEGKLETGWNVVIVDDVITTGKSAYKAILEVEKKGANVVAVICILDRLKGAKELLEKYNYKSIFAINDFGEIANVV